MQYKRSAYCISTVRLTTIITTSINNNNNSDVPLIVTEKVWIEDLVVHWEAITGISWGGLFLPGLLFEEKRWSNLSERKYRKPALEGPMLSSRILNSNS